MAALNRRNRHLTADYDRMADVLYITIQPAIADEGEDGPHGVILRYGMANNTPTGATIVGFGRNRWSERVDALARIVAAHLARPQIEIEEIIRGALPTRSVFPRRGTI